MDPTTRDRLTARAIWVRFLYMALFIVAFQVGAGVAALIMVVQFALTLITGSSNAELRDLGSRLGRYLAEIVSFQTFASDARPYPFQPWPAGPGMHRPAGLAGDPASAPGN